MTPTDVNNPFCIIDFLSWCSSWFGDKICNVFRKFFISNWLFDNSHAWRLRAGRFWCWNFPFACVNRFGKRGRRTGAETLVVAGPLRTKVVVAKERLSELFCTEIGVSCSGQKESALLEERPNHEDSSSSWKMRPSRRLDCPELWIHKVAVTEACRKQIQIGTVQHLEIWIRYWLIQCPLCFDYFVYSQ